jgi:hypothetical protein
MRDVLKLRQPKGCAESERSAAKGSQPNTGAPVTKPRSMQLGNAASTTKLSFRSGAGAIVAQAIRIGAADDRGGA